MNAVVIDVSKGKSIVAALRPMLDMNAVVIDVSKGKSIVAALRPMGEVALLPREFLHTEISLEQMAYHAELNQPTTSSRLAM